MEELKENLNEEELKDIYDVYLRVKTLIDELNGHKKDLPPREEL